MYRFLAFLILVIAILAVIGFSRGWFAVTTQSNSSNDRVDVGLTVNKSTIRQDTHAAAERARELGTVAKRDAQNLGDKLNREIHDHTHLSADVVEVKLEPGSKADVHVTRDTKELKAEQLGLRPSAGSNLLASGGTFAEGGREATVTIEAPRDAHDGTVTVDSDSGTQTIKVTVLSAHEQAR